MADPATPSQSKPVEAGASGEDLPSEAKGKGLEMSEISVDNASSDEADKKKVKEEEEMDEIAIDIGPSEALAKYYQDDPNASFYDKHIAPNMNKGTYSNLITFTVMIIGLILASTVQLARHVEVPNAGNYIATYVLAGGLFGFAGGITNWLAVKMLFDKIPGLVGSGIIPARFKEIREVVKNTIMKTFFDPEFLKKYLSQKAGQFVAGLDLEEHIRKALASDFFNELIDRKLADLANRPEGMMLAMMGMQPQQLAPMVKMVNVEKIRREIDRLMTTKLEELSPPIVKKLMEEVIRKHLGWLIVWGNVFGGLIGIVSTAIGY